MEFNYLSEKKRMLGLCGCLDDIGRCRNCCKCPFYNMGKPGCIEFELKNPKEATQIVREWAEKNPRQTMLEKFKELFPNAKLTSRGEPPFCPDALGWSNSPMCNANCIECWDRPYIE